MCKYLLRTRCTEKQSDRIPHVKSGHFIYKSIVHFLSSSFYSSVSFKISCFPLFFFIFFFILPLFSSYTIVRKPKRQIHACAGKHALFRVPLNICDRLILVVARFGMRVCLVCALGACVCFMCGLCAWVWTKFMILISETRFKCRQMRTFAILYIL